MAVTLAVNSAEFYKDYTEISVFLRIILTGRKEPLMFGATGIKISHEGDIIGDAKLVLLSNVEIPVSGNNVLLRLLGKYGQKTGEPQDLSYATIDCQGLKHLGISAEIELSSNLCSYVGSDGKVNASKKVLGAFQTQVDNWTDLVARVSFPSFEVKGLTGFVWNLQDAVVDFSDLRNDQAMTFPNGYSQYLIPGNEVLWKGVYVKDLSVTLPPQFVKNEKGRVGFYAHDMLIDENGVTGIFGGKNILSYNEGNASGWAFSIDNFNLRLMANNLEEANFDGMLGLPISEKSRLTYKGRISEGNNYYMQVQPVENLSFDLFQAKADLDANSYVKFNVVDGKFRPEAMLHGRMAVEVAIKKGDNQTDSVSNGKKLTTINGIEFRSLHLMTEAPYITVGYLGYKGNAKLANLPISIREMAVNTNGQEASLAIGLDVVLMDNTFKGSTRLEVIGRLEQGRLQSWKYSHVNVGQIALDATIAEQVQLKGNLSLLNDDPLYGDGFSGGLAAQFKDKSPLKGLKSEMRAMFGCKDFRYWFVDGIASLPSGIPIGPAISLTGFGGGIAYKMKPQGAAKGIAGQVMTATSMTYVPDSTCSLNIKAATLFTLGQSKSIGNGEACCEIAFNKNGGLNFAGFYGYAQFVSSIPGLGNVEKAIGEKYQKIIDIEKNAAKQLPGSVQSQLEKAKQYDPNAAAKLYTDQDKLGKANFTAAMGLQYNFQESSFHATFDLYVNALGGMLTGAGSDKRAGWAVLHIDPKDWYLHLGTPSDRIGLKMGFGKILNIQTGSYLMAGTQIPAAPGVPSQVASILQQDTRDLDYMKDLNLVEGGKGFAFGSSMNISTGDLSFLILYANYAAGAGFDILLKDYGEVQCQGRSGAIGLNGWYANGQAYAYLHGELGVNVNLWFMKAKVPVLTADFATLMQAKLPNPSSFKAYIGVKAKVLGLVNVNCRFKMLIGEDCEMVVPGGSPLNMAMINDLSPTDKASDISVFTAPQATFNMAIGKPFKMQDDQGERTFRLKLKDFVVKDAGDKVAGEVKWNTDNDIASFYSHEVLTPRKEMTATVSVCFEEEKNGHFAAVYTSGKEAVETKSVTFNTSDAPKDIPLQNVVHSYPVVGQKYFLGGESPNGYLQLQMGQSYLFPDGYEYKVKITNVSGQEHTTPFTYNESLKRIEFPLPETLRSTTYSVNFLSMSKGEATSGASSGEKVADVSGGDSISVDSKTATAETRTDLGASLLAYDFATSRYSTFTEKVGGIQKGIPAVNKLSSDVLMFEYETVGMEPFDLTELSGTQQTGGKPLVDVAATLEDSYYQNKVRPLIYQDYPVDGTIRLKNRDENGYGVPPVKALPVMTSYLGQLEANQMTGFVTKRFPYYYNLPKAYKDDFVDLQNQVINSYLQNTANSTFRKFLNAGFPFISPGNYGIRLQYMLPGGAKGTSATFDYKNFIE